MAETIDQQFIEYIVKTLVGDPDAVKIERRIDEKGVLLELHVAPEDLGRVIGRSGGTAKSIRTLLRALGVKNDARYNLKIVDTNEDGSRRGPVQTSSDEQAPSDTDAPVADETTKETEEATETETEAEAGEEEPEAEQPAEEPQEEEEPEQEESSVDRHREDLKDLTDFDI